MEEVILVNEKDEVTGRAEKLLAHEKGLLHRAFSVFIFNDKNQMLLQQRALNKYHSGGLWSNACCSHPRPDEETSAAAQRRLIEEMGIHTSLKKVFDFIYFAQFDNGLIENEFDHVYVGNTNEKAIFSEEEIMDAGYFNIETIFENIKNHPERFTEWFKIAFPQLMEKLKS